MQQGGEVLSTVEALRNTRDGDVTLRGLNQLRRAVASSEGGAFLRAYLQHTGSFDDLQAVWDAQLTVRVRARHSSTAGRREGLAKAG